MADTAAIATDIQRIHGEYYGQTPALVRVFEDGDILVVLIEETFTRAEQILIERGEADEVQIIRRRFQLAVADQFIAIVQTATGRCVRSNRAKTKPPLDAGTLRARQDRRATIREWAGSTPCSSWLERGCSLVAS
jgi:hypothetical protein